MKPLFVGIVGGIILNNGIYAQQPKKPNLLVIMTDQQRYDALSIAGNTVLKTPNLDRLAQQGAWFKNAYTQCAVSGPTRASILTGCTVENHGVINNDSADSKSPQSAKLMPQKTFDQILTDNAGYHCEYYGKWHSPQFAGACYKNPVKYATGGRYIFASNGDVRFYKDNYLDQVFKRPDSIKFGELRDTYTERPYIPNILDKRYGMSQKQVDNSGIAYAQPDLHGTITIPDEHSLTAYRARQTIDALQRLKDSTFSITCSFHFPHAPMLPSKYYSDLFPLNDMPVPASIADPMSNSPYINSNSRTKNPEYADPQKIKYMISDYYALVKEIDDWVGKILDKLDTLGLTNNTLVIFVSDHGEMLGSHGMREKNVFLEESAHVPLLIRFPERIAPGTVVNGYVSTMALFPTILDYLNIPESQSNAKSLSGLIAGTDTTLGKYVVTEWLSSSDKAPAYMIVKDDWKMFIPYTVSSSVINALYNLKDDPYEMNNLIGNNPKRNDYELKTKELRADMLTWLKQNNSKNYDGVKNRFLTGTNPPPPIPSNITENLGQFVVYYSSGKIIINSNHKKIESISVTDLSGREVFTYNKSFTGENSINVNLKSGIYIINLKSDNKNIAQKIRVE
jgi:arylsulfatase A-like enzyme